MYKFLLWHSHTDGENCDFLNIEITVKISFNNVIIMYSVRCLKQISRDKAWWFIIIIISTSLHINNEIFLYKFGYNIHVFLYGDYINRQTNSDNISPLCSHRLYKRANFYCLSYSSKLVLKSLTNNGQVPNQT